MEKADAFSWLTAAGLAFGLAGDQLLAMRRIRKEKRMLFFAAGTGAFALGHLLYIAALMSAARPSPLAALLLFALLLAVSLVYGKCAGVSTGAFKIAGTCYIGMVCLMAAVALASALKAGGAALWLFAAGGLSFAVSDNVLGAYSFGKEKRWGANWLIHISYYLAQMLIALSILLK